MSFETDAAELRSVAEEFRAIRQRMEDIKYDIFTANRRIGAVIGADSSGPSALVEAITTSNGAVGSLAEAMAFVSTSRETVETYCATLGY